MQLLLRSLLDEFNVKGGTEKWRRLCYTDKSDTCGESTTRANESTLAPGDKIRSGLEKFMLVSRTRREGE